jgi:hypothetical protein
MPKNLYPIIDYYYYYYFHFFFIIPKNKTFLFFIFFRWDHGKDRELLTKLIVFKFIFKLTKTRTSGLLILKEGREPVIGLPPITTPSSLGEVIGRGHLAGPCPALSYVERAILLLECLTFFFFPKKKKNQIFEYIKTSSADPFFSFLSSPQIFPPSLHLPQNLPTVNHRSELRRPSGSGDQFRTSPPPFRAPSFFRFRRGVLHKPATVPSSVILPVPTRCFA